MNIIDVVISKYNPILVNDNCKLFNTSALKKNKFRIVNWSSGLLLVHIGGVSGGIATN